MKTIRKTYVNHSKTYEKHYDSTGTHQSNGIGFRVLFILKNRCSDGLSRCGLPPQSSQGALRRPLNGFGQLADRSADATC